MADALSFGVHVTAGEIRDALNNAGDAGVQHVSVKIPTMNKRAFNAFSSAGFQLVDTQLEYAHDLRAQESHPVGYCATIRSFKKTDLKKAIAIAERSFTIDRWHSDQSLPDRKCDCYYGRWVMSCYHGYAKEILVAETSKELVGFLTLRVDGGKGRIDLTAVDKPYRGRGIYSTLVHAALEWARKEGLTGMLATTQIDNMGSRITWLRAGFVPSASCYVLHHRISAN